MKLIISLVLALFIGILGYLLYLNIREPIAFQEVKNAREDVVVSKLKEIRTAQELYRDITGEFAGDFDSLSYVLKNDSLTFENIMGDPDDPTNSNFIRTITKTPAIDTVRALGINLDSLRYVPFSNNETFEIAADTMTYQSTLVVVVEVGTQWKTFMGKYGIDKKYCKYDNSYNPSKMLKFGDMNAPNITGNWER